MTPRLMSDFRDNTYDHFFSRDPAAPVFRRLTTDGPRRPEMLEFLNRAGEVTPWHGRVADFPEYWGWSRVVVVYTDESAHAGEGKELLPYAQAQDTYPEAYCCLAIGKPGLSYRRLQIGERSFWLRYQSRSDWRSNVGEGAIEVIGSKTGYHPRIEQPLFAIDYVEAEDGSRLAVDYNVAPGMQGTGILNWIRASEIVGEIGAAMERFGVLARA